jgi:myo-inositol-hexaphosphate 3-phosphohydrolase
MMSKIVMIVLAGAAFATSTPAIAQEAPKQVPSQISSPPVAEPSQAKSDPAVLSNSELGELRGGESIVMTNQTMQAITSGNVINGDYSAGNVSLSDSALSNFNGVGNLLINTGAQVSLQTGMNITINVHQ